jgi:GPI mannosyltransferase 3
VLYWLLQAVGCDTAVAVAKGPQLLHGLIAAAADVTVLQLSKELHGEAVARWTLLCQLASWFNAYCLTRTYSSSVEAGLTAVGLLWYAKDYFSMQSGCRSSSHTATSLQVRWMILAALCCVLRPPSVLFWAAAAVVYVMACPYASRWRVIHRGLFIAGLVLASNTVWDRMWYGR